MAWSDKQIRLAHAAARAADWTDMQRRTVLGGFDGRGRLGQELTSKAPGLTNADFDEYMAVAEAEAGGQLMGKPPLHWADKANSGGGRQPFLIQQLVNTLKLTTDPDTGQQVIGEDDEGLSGIIHKATAGRFTAVDQLDRYGRHQVINALRKIAQRLNPQGVQA